MILDPSTSGDHRHRQRGDAFDHVRIDVLHEKFSLTTQAWIEFYGLLLFVFPLLAVVLIYAVPFVAYSFSIGEISEAPGGLPYRWAIKSVLFISFALLALAAVSRFLRVCAHLFHAPKPLPAKPSE